MKPTLVWYIVPLKMFTTDTKEVEKWKSAGHEVKELIEREEPKVFEEARNISSIQRESDFSVKLTFASVRSCSAFIKDFETNKTLPTYATLVDQIKQLTRDVAHWKSNHADLKERLHFMTDRSDIKAERTTAYRDLMATIAPLRAEINALRAEPLAYIYFHRLPDGEYDVRDSSNFTSGRPSCTDCIEAVIVPRKWRCPVCNGVGVVGKKSHEGELLPVQACLSCCNTKGIKPDQTQLAALAVQGHLSDEQATQILVDAGVLTPRNQDVGGD